MALKENLEKIDSLKKQLDELNPLSKEADQKLWEKFRLEWNFNSNHIEGNTLTYGETQLLLIFGKTTGDHEMREFEEMQAHDVAIKAIKEWAQDKTQELTEADIRNLNKIILVRPFWKEAITYDGQPTRRLIKIGDYKEHPNAVRLQSGGMFHYASPEETKTQMPELINWYRSNHTENALVLASELHYRYIRIHPFDDGNGRIARLLVNYVLMKEGFPPIIIKTGDKNAYLSALQKADVGDIEAFHEYMSKQLIWSLEIVIKAAKGESIEEFDDIEKEISIFKKKLTKTSDLISKSDSQIYELYQNGIKQLFELFLEKMQQFDELFTSKKINGEFRNIDLSTINFTDIKSINNYFSNSKVIEKENKPQRKFTSRNPESKFHIVSLIINHIGYKQNGTNNFDETNKITIRFHDFNYDILAQDEILIDKPYSQYLNNEEAKIIVNHCLKKTFNQIKLRPRGNL